MKQAYQIAIIVFLLYLLHITRNLSSVYYLLLSFSLCAFVISLASASNRLRLNWILLLTPLIWLYASVVTVFASGAFGSPYIGLVRLWSSFPLILVGYILATHSVATPMRVLCLFFSIAALSFPAQLLIGPISWFAEASERAGGIRFSSLAGSLTAYGVAIGVPALAAMVFFPRVLSIGVFTLLASGAVMSLQKAALLNILLSLGFAWWLGVLSLRKFIAILSLFSVMALSFLSFQSLGSSLNAASFIEGTIKSDSELTADVSVSESITSRITSLPRTALDFFSGDMLWLGYGAFGGAGALGYETLPMAHNGFVELLLIFGYLIGSLLCCCLIFYFVHSVKILSRRSRIIRSEIGFVSAAYSLWFINYIFSGGFIFHPIGSAVFWLLLFRLRALLKLPAVYTPGSNRQKFLPPSSHITNAIK